MGGATKDVRRDIVVKTLNLPSIFVDTNNVDRGAGKTDAASDRSKKTKSEYCLLSSVASSGFDLVTFINRLEGAYKNEDGDGIQQ